MSDVIRNRFFIVKISRFSLQVCRECCAGEICNLSLPRNDTNVLALSHLFNTAVHSLISMLLVMITLLL